MAPSVTTISTLFFGVARRRITKMRQRTASSAAMTGRLSHRRSAWTTPIQMALRIRDAATHQPMRACRASFRCAGRACQIA